MNLDYRALIYAAICTTPWRHADLARVEIWLRQRHGVLGHLSVQEFRAEAIVGAQTCIERPEEAARILVPFQIGVAP